MSGRTLYLFWRGNALSATKRPLREKRKGQQLDGASGEWLVHLYEAEGIRVFERLNGLFSGLLIDKRLNKAFLFNDRYGMERIYFYETDDGLYFSSEAKALLRIFPECRAFDEQGVAQFLAFGCTLEHRTLFRGIQTLPGGSLWSFENGKCEKGHYFSPQTWESQPILAERAFEAQFQATLERILPRYFKSPSRIGISLTGGLDTRMIMACRPQAESEPVCYTFSGKDRRTLDDRLAARVAKACNLEHHILSLGPEFFSDFSSYADRAVHVTDGTFGVLGAHEIYLNAQARQLAPVRLTGNFGGEVLRGVSTFKPTGLSANLLRPEFRPLVAAAEINLSNDRRHPVTSAAFREIPWKLFGSVAAGRSQVTFRTPYLDNELVALAYQAPERLRQSSLPASRFVKANSAALSDIPTDRGFAGNNSGLEFLFRRAFAEVTFKVDYYNTEGLPRLLSPFDPVLRRISSGLGILGLHKYLPYRHWLRTGLAGYLKDKLADAQTRQMPFWNPDFLKNMATEHISGRKNYTREINVVLTLEAVERLLFRDLPRGASGSGHLASGGRAKESLLPT